MSPAQHQDSQDTTARTPMAVPVAMLCLQQVSLRACMALMGQVAQPLHQIRYARAFWLYFEQNNSSAKIWLVQFDSRCWTSATLFTAQSFFKFLPHSMLAIELSLCRQLLPPTSLLQRSLMLKLFSTFACLMARSRRSR